MSPEAQKNSQKRLLIVDDDAGQRSLLSSFLGAQGFTITVVDSGENALAKLDSGEFDMMISDVRMPGITGLELMRRARRKHQSLPILLVTGFADIRDAVEAIRDGAVDYLSKPIDLDQLLAAVHKATGQAGEYAIKFNENRQLPPGIIAGSPLMQALFRDVSLIAPSESRVLITGESGVGKEVLAEVLHAWSPRAAGPLVKVNCAAIPETLLESELFGHEKGSFTGATAQRIGRFEHAANGTIFLDEIAEMSPQLQAKLLRITQNASFQRIGSNNEIRSNARIVAATNRNLDAEVAAGRFREDLFYRLSVVELNIPPLRERQEDVLPLARQMLGELNGGRARLAASVPEVLERYSWPGNVRELRNAMERAALLSGGELILPEHLPARITSAVAAITPTEKGKDAQRLEEIERDAVLEALRKNSFNRSETARLLGISRRALLYKVQRLRAQGYQVDH